jgi:hypothetical protein
LVVVVAWGHVVSEANDLFPGPLPPNPYFVPSEALTLYVMLPTTVLATLIVFWAPGIAAVLRLARADAFGPALLKAFAIAFLVHVGAASLLKVASPGGAAPGAFRWLILVTAAIAALVCLVGGRKEPLLETSAPRADARLLWMLFAVFAGTILLLPILFWQDMNPDGLEAFTTGRSLRSHLLPRLPTGEQPGLNLGMISMAYPVHWFMELFGVIESAARLPILLYASLILAGIVALAEWGRAKPLTPTQMGIVVLNTAVFVVAMAFNDTYHPYSADIASPANIDILSVGFLLGTVYFFWSGELAWFLVFALLAHATRPTGVMVLVLWTLGVALASRPLFLARWRWLAGALLACIGVTVVLEQVVALVTGIHPGAETLGILDRMRYLTVTDVRRFAFVLVPCGVVPVLSMFLWKRQDALCRCIVLVSAAYFAFFFSLAFTALHHFALVMVLPVVVFARMLTAGVLGSAWQPAAVVAGLVCLVASLPASFAVDRSVRDLGRVTRFDIGDYEGDYAGYRAAFAQKGLLEALFLPHWQAEDPGAERVGSPWPQVHYASRTAKVGHEGNYWVRPAGEPTPEGFSRIAGNDTATLYVRDFARWEHDRTHPPPVEFRSPVYEIPRETLFKQWGVPAGNYDLDLRALAEMLHLLPPASPTAGPEEG